MLNSKYVASLDTPYYFQSTQYQYIFSQGGTPLDDELASNAVFSLIANSIVRTSGIALLMSR